MIVSGSTGEVSIDHSFQSFACAPRPASFATWFLALSLAISLMLDAPGAESGSVPNGLRFHGRREQTFHFQATVLANRHVTMVTQSPSTALEVVDTREGFRFYNGRFTVKKVHRTEKTSTLGTSTSYVVNVHDSYTGRSFALSQGVQVPWPEYSALLSGDSRQGSRSFVVREGAEFSFPQSGSRARFRVIRVEEEFVVIANTATPNARFRLTRGQ